MAGSAFSGYTLVGIAGRLQVLDLTPSQSAALVAVRFAILGIAIAAVWHTLLAPAHRWHPAYAVSGWYLVAGAALALLAGLYRSGVVPPPAGLLLWSAGALAFIAAEVSERVIGHRSQRP